MSGLKWKSNPGAYWNERCVYSIFELMISKIESRKYDAAVTVLGAGVVARSNKNKSISEAKAWCESEAKRIAREIVELSAHQSPSPKLCLTQQKTAGEVR